MPSRQDLVVEEFLRRIAPLRSRIEKIILFGSRARDDWKPYSDYDFLIVVPVREQALVDVLHEAAMEVLFSTQRLISLKIFARKEYDRLTAIPTPFMRNVLKEGVSLG
jgi:predicted nucleotidyltransferase